MTGELARLLLIFSSPTRAESIPALVQNLACVLMGDCSCGTRMPGSGLNRNATSSKGYPWLPHKRSGCIFIHISNLAMKEISEKIDCLIEKEHVPLVPESTGLRLRLGVLFLPIVHKVLKPGQVWLLAWLLLVPGSCCTRNVWLRAQGEAKSQ